MAGEILSVTLGFSFRAFHGWAVIQRKISEGMESILASTNFFKVLESVSSSSFDVIVCVDVELRVREQRER